MPDIAIYGGTFDPIHNGHIKTAIAIQNYFHFDRLLFLPCKVPVLKDKAQASATQRIDMLRIALAEQKKENHFDLDLTEINREGPSYMIDTLKSFRQRFGDDLSITMIIGQDSFNQLPQWHLWEELITKANILVIDRPGSNKNPESASLKQLVINHETHSPEQIKNQAFGLIYRFNAGDYDISSTKIREAIRSNHGLNDLLPSSVLEYIKTQQLYF